MLSRSQAEGESAPKRARFSDEDNKSPPVNNHVHTEEEKAKQKQKPIATEPVPGTPWFVEFTSLFEHCDITIELYIPYLLW